jgi:hypothetical protein
MEPTGQYKALHDGSIILELPVRYFPGSRIFHVKLMSPLGKQLTWRRPDQCQLSGEEWTPIIRCLIGNAAKVFG